MSSFHSLFWKEFHELRWRVAFGVVTMAGFAAIGLRARMMEDLGVFMSSCLFGIFLFPLFVSMGTIAEDREDGSSRFLSSLPVSPGKILWSKFLSGSIAVVVPLLVTWIVAIVLAGGREISMAYLSRIFFFALLSALACFLWYLTFGVRQTTQWRVGLVGVALMMVWLTSVMVTETVVGNSDVIKQFGFAPCPYVFFFFLPSATHKHWLLLIPMFSHPNPHPGFPGMVAHKAVFGRDKEDEMTATLSLIWKEYREVRLLTLCSLAFFVGLPTLEGLDRVVRRGQPFIPDMGIGLVLGLGGIYALFVAIATTCADLSHPLDGFWRSRPIPVFHSLAVKYSVGLFSVFAVTVTPLVLAIVYDFHARPDRHSYTICLSDGAFPPLMCHTPVLILLFTASFLIGCLIRKPVETAILSSAAGLLVYFGPLLSTKLADFSIFTMLDSYDVVTIIRNEPSYLSSLPWSEYCQIPLGLPGTSFYLVAQPAYVKYALVIFFLSLALWGCAVYAVKKNKCFAMHQKGIVWALGIVALFLLGAASVQIGSNLEPDEIIKWEGKPRSVRAMAERDGKVMTLSVLNVNDYQREKRETLLRVFDLADIPKASSWEPPATWIGTKSWHTYYTPQMIWPPDLPNRVYYLVPMMERPPST